jgi:hypothetical protein
MGQIAGVLLVISIFPVAYGKIMMLSYMLKLGDGFTSDDLQKYRRVYLSGWVIFGVAFLLFLVS